MIPLTLLDPVRGISLSLAEVDAQLIAGDTLLLDLVVGRDILTVAEEGPYSVKSIRHLQL